MEEATAASCEIEADFRLTTRHYIPEDNSPYFHRSKNPKLASMNECFEKKIEYHNQPGHPDGFTQLCLNHVYADGNSQFSSFGNTSLEITGITKKVLFVFEISGRNVPTVTAENSCSD